MSGMKKHRWCRIAPVIAGALVTLVISLFIPLPDADFAPWSVQSLRILDRSGIVLREFPNDQEGRGQWMALADIAPALQQATLAVEDRRFYAHPGIDPVAIARSVRDNLLALRFRSGGSTLTQQVVRNVYHRPRTVTSKLVEMWDALRLERKLSKQQILEQYLNRAPYGNQLFGVEAASRWYFGKPARDVSLAEAAFLAGLPNAPTALNPHRSMAQALARQGNVLTRMLDQRKITSEEYDRAAAQPIQIIPPEAHFKAPHVAGMVEAMGSARPEGSVRTTIDYPLQEQVQWMMRGHLTRLLARNVHNAAAVVIENRTGEIRALVGSADFFDSTHNGQVNGVTARRQPGSAIKPFMYALTFEHGLTPATLLADIPTAIPEHHGDYVPENYDKRFHGPVRIRSALACSYNVPAVRALQRIGKSIFLEKLKDLGFSSLEEDAEFYGYGLTLGNAEVSLLELATAYMTFPNGGLWKPATLLPATSDPQTAHRVYDERAAFLITDILKDGVARRPAFGGSFHFPFPCAVKTGTTKDYKDNWTVGFTTRYTVGVWVGNFDGKEMRQVSGVSGAGPIFTDIVMFLHTPPYGQPPGDFPVPEHLSQLPVCVRSGNLPSQSCGKTVNEWFIDGKTPVDKCGIHREYLARGSDGRQRSRIYEVFPEEYRLWAASERLPVPPPDARRASGAPARDERADRLMIVSPNSGDYFKIDPVLRRAYQSITIAGFIPRGMRDVRLRVNGTETIPFDGAGVQWHLRKGVFRFQLCGIAKETQVTSAAVVINVE
jgi:penicillin-binding protein 1C